MPIPQMITAEFLETYQPREFVELVGHPSTGKSRAILSIAKAWKVLRPGNTVYIVDTEHGILKLWKKSFRDVDNINYYLCQSMDDVILTLDELFLKLNANDWLCIESMARVWEYAQELGYQRISGMGKAEYIEKRLKEKGARTSPIPQPDQFWQIAKSAHGHEFLDRLTLKDSIALAAGCNIVCSSTMGTQRPPQLQSKDRREVRESLGVNLDIEGWPRHPYYMDTVIHMTSEVDGFFANVLKDRGAETIGQNIKFVVKDFWFDFTQYCRQPGA